MTATVTRLDAQRPARQPGILARLRNRFRALLPEPAVAPLNLTLLGKIIEAHADAEPVSPAFDLAALDLAAANRLILRTRDGRRARVKHVDYLALSDSDPRPVQGEIELVDRVTNHTVWVEASWFSDGAYCYFEHAWDLVSVETITCVQCGCDDFHACRTPMGPCAWVTIEANGRDGLCSGCAGVAA